MGTTIDAAVSYDEYVDLPESNTPSEVVAGRVIVTPQPTPRHQLAAYRLAKALEEAALPAGLHVLPSPVDWVLSRAPLHVRQPDVTVLTTEQVRGARLETPPLLAAEILSPTSQERDLITTSAEYAAAGLAWYWIVDPEEPAVLVLRNVDGVFQHHARASGDELLRVDQPFAVALRPADLTI